MERHPDPAESKLQSPVGIKEIAKALDISIGTVDRALHSRPGINSITRAKVLKMAETMGYRPNLAARYLKSQKALLISVHLPTEISFFFDGIRRGIREAADQFAPALRVEFRNYPRLGKGDTELFERALAEGCSGMVISPGMPAVLKPLIRKAVRNHVPVVCVATDAPGTERLAAVSACPFTSGAIAGELLCRIVDRPGKFVVVTGSLETEDHVDKLNGFRSSLQTLAGSWEVAQVIEAHDDPQTAYRRTASVLREHRNVSAIYVSTANSLPVLKAIAEAGCSDKISVVTTDLFPALVPLIRSGRVFATLNQRPLTQGRMAFQALYQFLVEGKCPQPNIRLAPHIVMRSNLDLFAEQLHGEGEAEAKEGPETLSEQALRPRTRRTNSPPA